MEKKIHSLNALQEELSKAEEEGYRLFQAKLMPTVDKTRVRGIRVPFLRKIAARLDDETAKAFLSLLPHPSYEEDNLHAFLIERIGDFDKTLKALDTFLPYVDNWATCDMMRPKCLAQNPTVLREKIEVWLASPHPYTVRYGIGMLMTHFLGEAYSPAILARVADIRSQEYYIQMMCAWFFATALVAHAEDALPYLAEKRLDRCVQKLTVRKACESRCLSPALKERLRSLG